MSRRRSCVLTNRIHEAAVLLPYAAPGKTRAGQRVPSSQEESQEEWLTQEQVADDQRLLQLAVPELSFV